MQNNRIRTASRGDILGVAFPKGKERYVWLFREQYYVDVLVSIGLCAENPELSLTWDEALQVLDKIDSLTGGSAT